MSGARDAVPASLERARALTEPALRAAVERLHPTLRIPIHYHLGWADAQGNPTPGGGGKGIRPALGVLSSEAAGASGEVGVPAAVSVELVHDFSLLHDDVIDGDTERRHRPTVWAQYGIGPAVIAGDALVALAVGVLVESDSPHGSTATARLVRATNGMITGQAIDMDFESRLDVTLEECVAMAAGKTGALFGCAASLGSVLAGADDAVVDALADFGHHLGLSFQAVDDLLGIWGRPEVTGKPAGSDLYQRKKSIPVVFALTRGDANAEELLASFARDVSPDEADVQRAAVLVEASGGRDLTERMAREHLDLARAALERAPLVPTACDELREIAAFVTARDF